MTRLSRRAILTTGAAAIGTSIAGCLGDGTDEWERETTLPASTATQYQGPNCNCCEVYADYLQDHLGVELDVSVVDDLESVKRDHGVGSDLRSCHTIVLDGYVVEGHVPVAVIETLFDTEPDIDGIALPGMPPGSPGMGGDKSGTWTLYELGSGTDSVYTEL